MSTEVATKDAPTLASALTSMGPEIQRALPKHMSGDRIARITLTEIRKNPALSRCDPGSFFGALLTASALGLEPGVNGECYLVPYKNKCELIVGYQGVAKLFWQHPMAKRITAEYVCENDHFKFSKGLSMTLEHEPATTNRGPVIGYYAIAELKGGALAFDYFTADQIKALRGGVVGTKGVADPEHWMERKTALKQVLKLMPKSVELSTAVRVDETVGSFAVAEGLKDGSGLPQIEHAEPSASTPSTPSTPEPDDGWGDQGALPVDGAS